MMIIKSDIEAFRTAGEAMYQTILCILQRCCIRPVLLCNESRDHNAWFIDSNE